MKFPRKQWTRDWDLLILFAPEWFFEVGLIESEVVKMLLFAWIRALPLAIMVFCCRPRYIIVLAIKRCSSGRAMTYEVWYMLLCVPFDEELI